MELFKKHRTIEEILPGFLIEKEAGLQPKSFYPYNWCSKVFIDWLKEHHLANQPMRKITSDNVADFFHYLGRDNPSARTVLAEGQLPQILIPTIVLLLYILQYTHHSEYFNHYVYMTLLSKTNTYNQLQ